MARTSQDRYSDKRAAINVAKIFDFFPVESKLVDSQDDAPFVTWCQCSRCQKEYQWNQLVRMTKHHRTCRRK